MQFLPWFCPSKKLYTARAGQPFVVEQRAHPPSGKVEIGIMDRSDSYTEPQAVAIQSGDKHWQRQQQDQKQEF